MNTSKKTAIIVGILFIVATVTSSLGFAVRDSILDAPDRLVRLSANDTQVIVGALLVLMDCVAVVFIPAMLYPILKKHNQALALGYLGLRIVESVVIVVGEICVLVLLTASRSFSPGASDASYLQTLGTLLLAAYRQGTHVIGVQIIFGLTALLLNYLLVRTKLVPGFISIWGLVGAFLLLAAGLIQLFGPGLLSTITTAMNLPIALQEMVFAVWLIVKGFNPQD